MINSNIIKAFIAIASINMSLARLSREITFADLVKQELVRRELSERSPQILFSKSVAGMSRHTKEDLRIYTNGLFDPRNKSEFTVDKIKKLLTDQELVLDLSLQDKSGNVQRYAFPQFLDMMLDRNQRRGICHSGIKKIKIIQALPPLPAPAVLPPAEDAEMTIRAEKPEVTIKPAQHKDFTRDEVKALVSAVKNALGIATKNKRKDLSELKRLVAKFGEVKLVGTTQRGKYEVTLEDLLNVKKHARFKPGARLVLGETVLSQVT